MDDLTVTTRSVPGCRWILNGLEEMISWASMSFKLAKLRSLMLKKGKVTGKFCFSLGTTKIPSLTEQPVKSLGKVYCKLQAERRSLHKSDQPRPRDLASRGGQVWPPWQVQGLDLPAWYAPSDPLAPLGL